MLKPFPAGQLELPARLLPNGCRCGAGPGSIRNGEPEFEIEPGDHLCFERKDALQAEILPLRRVFNRKAGCRLGSGIGFGSAPGTDRGARDFGFGKRMHGCWESERNAQRGGKKWAAEFLFHGFFGAWAASFFRRATSEKNIATESRSSRTFTSARR